MPAALENVIVAAAPDPATSTVRLTWANGSETVARFGHLAGKGVFAPLGDAAFFSQVRVGERGRTLACQAKSISARMRFGSTLTPRTTRSPRGRWRPLDKEEPRRLSRRA